MNVIFVQCLTLRIIFFFLIIIRVFDMCLVDSQEMLNSSAIRFPNSKRPMIYRFLFLVQDLWLMHWQLLAWLNNCFYLLGSYTCIFYFDQPDLLVF